MDLLFNCNLTVMLEARREWNGEWRKGAESASDGISFISMVDGSDVFKWLH